MFTAHSIQKILNVPGPIQCKCESYPNGTPSYLVLLMSRYLLIKQSLTRVIKYSHHCNNIILNFSKITFNTDTYEFSVNTAGWTLLTIIDKQYLFIILFVLCFLFWLSSLIYNLQKINKCHMVGCIGIVK